MDVIQASTVPVDRAHADCRDTRVSAQAEETGKTLRDPNNMYRIVIAALSLVVLSATNAFAQKTGIFMPVGKWSGIGTFFRYDEREKFGTIAIVLESSNGSAVTGKIGGATLVDGRARKIREVVEITGKLDGALTAKPGLETKRRFVLLVTSLGDSTMNAEFHLKSNAWFDAKMVEGRVVLRK